MNEKNKFRVLGFFLFPFIACIYVGDFWGKIGKEIEKFGEDNISKFGEIIIKRLKLEE